MYSSCVALRSYRVRAEAKASPVHASPRFKFCMWCDVCVCERVSQVRMC